MADWSVLGEIGPTPGMTGAQAFARVSSSARKTQARFGSARALGPEFRLSGSGRHA